MKLHNDFPGKSKNDLLPKREIEPTIYSIGVNSGRVRTHDSTSSGTELNHCTSGYLRLFEKYFLISNRYVKIEQRNRHDCKSRPDRVKA